MLIIEIPTFVSSFEIRILLANAAAADFYGKCLMTLPSAGLARKHLQSRALSPASVRKFALGYAPDAYFNLPRKAKRGDGSLVYWLRDLGFSVNEIVEAGLATRINKNNEWKNKKNVLDSITEVVNINSTVEGKLLLQKCWFCVYVNSTFGPLF